MSSFQINLSRNRNISIYLKCTHCTSMFSTELDTDFGDVQFPLNSNDKLYCIECEECYEYSIAVNLDRYVLTFTEDLMGYLDYSDNMSTEYTDSIPVEPTPSKSKQFYYIQIDRLKKILRIEIAEFITDQALNRLAFSGVITSLETYLNEVFLSVVFEDEYTLEKFVKEYEPYKKEQVSFSEIFSKFRKLENRVREDLNYFIYHNVGKLIKIFSIFNFELDKFPEFGVIAAAIQKRHDFVHRSGLDKHNNFQEVSKREVLDLISITNNLVEYIDKKIKQKAYLPFKPLDDFLF